MTIKSGSRLVFSTAALVALVFGLSSCSKGCGGGGPAKVPDGQQIPNGTQPPKLKELPGHFVEGDLQIHPFDRYLPVLYGPYVPGKANSMQFRVLNKAWQTVDNAKLVFSGKPPGGEAKSDICSVKFEKEGVYRVICTYDKPGEWEIVVTAEAAGVKGKMGYKLEVEESAPGSAAPETTPVPPPADTDENTAAEQAEKPAAKPAKKTAPKKK